MINPEQNIYKQATSVRNDILWPLEDPPEPGDNVLGFYLFSGALDVRATTINEEMKLAAVHAIAALAKETIPEEVIEAYGGSNIPLVRIRLSQNH